MEYRIIKSPSAGTREILLRRRSAPATAPWPACDAIGLVQGRLLGPGPSPGEDGEREKAVQEGD